MTKNKKLVYFMTKNKTWKFVGIKKNWGLKIKVSLYGVKIYLTLNIIIIKLKYNII